MTDFNEVVLFINSAVFANIANPALSSAISPSHGKKFGTIASLTTTAAKLAMMVALSSETFDTYRTAITIGTEVIGTVMSLLLTPIDRDTIAPMIVVQGGLFAIKSLAINSATNLNEWLGCVLNEQCQEPLIPRLSAFLIPT